MSWLVMADQSETRYRMKAAAPYSSSPIDELREQRRYWSLTSHEGDAAIVEIIYSSLKINK